MGRESEGEEGMGSEREEEGEFVVHFHWLHGLCVYLASTNAQSIIIELQDFEGVAGGAGQEGCDGLHSSRTKCIVAEIQLC